MTQKEIKELIKKLVQEYTGTGASGGNAGDGNNITSPRPFADDEEELENYLYKNIYGGEGGQWVGDRATLPSYNRDPRGGMLELKSFIKKYLKEQLDPATTAGFADERVKLQRALARVDVKETSAQIKAMQGPLSKIMADTTEPLDQANKSIRDAADAFTSAQNSKNKLRDELNDLNKLEVPMEISFEEKEERKKELEGSITKKEEEIEALETQKKAAIASKEGIMTQRNQAVAGNSKQKAELMKLRNDQIKAISKIGKEGENIQEQAYGHATLTTQGIPNSSRAVAPKNEYPFISKPKSRLPGVWESESTSFKVVNTDTGKTIDFGLDQAKAEEIVAAAKEDNINAKVVKMKDVNDVGNLKDEPIDPDYQGPSYDEVYLKNKLVGFKDAYEYDKEKGEITIYPDLGALKWKSRSTQEIVFKLIEGNLHFVRAFGMTRSYDELKKVLPELGQMGNSSYSGFMNVGVDDQPISLAKYGISGIEIAHDMIQALNIGREGEAAAQSKHYGAIRTPGTGGTGMDEGSGWDGAASKYPGMWDGKPSEKNNKTFPAVGEMVKEYITSRKNSNLMEHMDSYKREILLESTMKKIFKWFDIGKSNEEVLRFYASKGISVPETFISKARKQYENLKKAKLEIELSDQESKDFKNLKVEKPENPKQISNRLFKEYIDKEITKLIEAKTIKKFPIPPEIKNALIYDLKMKPLIRFVKNLKAVNSIPPSYRVFLLNNNYFDIVYEEYSLMVKVEKEEYYLGNIDEKNYAIKHINRLLTDPIIKSGDDELEDTPDTSDTPSTPPSPETPEA